MNALKSIVIISLDWIEKQHAEDERPNWQLLGPTSSSTRKPYSRAGDMADIVKVANG
jgi:predicted  nucleic acid-binding Zn ribbon protein